MQTELIRHYFPETPEAQMEKFERLKDLYEAWNAKINVISRKDMDHFYERHVLHSLGIAKVMAFQPGTRVLDVGTGGGFPGIPLAILFPESDFHLVDSIGKKIRVVEEVAASLKLWNVTAEQTRAEQLSSSYDFVVSRAVTRMKPFTQWVAKKILNRNLNALPNGILYLKGGDLKEEMLELKRPFRIYSLSYYFKEEFFETKKVVHVRLK